MDLLESVMELLNNNSSASISGTNNTSSTQHSENLYQIPMEANNVAQETGDISLSNPNVGEDINGTGVGESVVVEQQQQPTLEETFSPLLPRLELKLPRSSSSSESETEEVANPTAGTSADGNGERAASPPPNCAICLGRCKNKCFTDSCMHQFCFKCLCEWSKVKPECPLCKQTFKSIIHNVKSEDQFEEYHVQPPTVQIAHPQFEMDLTQMRIFGVVSQNIGRNEAWNERVHRPLFIYPGNNGSGAVSSSGNLGASGGNSRVAQFRNLRNQYVYRGELIDLYRQDYPDSTLSQLWRRYVYDRKLYALPVCDITGRFRESSSQYYRDNPAQIHRLVPWISRDLQCLLRQTQHDVNTVLESINSALILMNILSPAFRRRLQTFLGNKTAHFIHELNNFARSPYDMIGYDRVVEYSPQSSEDVVIEFSSSDDTTDNDEIDVADDSAVVIPNTSSTNAINLTIHNRLTSNGSGRAAELTASGTSGSVRSGVEEGVSYVIDLRGEPEDPSTSVGSSQSAPQGNANAAQSAVTVADNIELTSGSSDECEFVLERKPPHLRTPEMVSLDSASDSDVVFVDESKPLNKTTFSTSEEELDGDGSAERKTRSSGRIKISALVEAKKRNQQPSNAARNDAQSTSEVYNVGASTSAALRLSIQQRSDRSRMRRSKYALRNSKADSNNPPKRRGKRLPSESSHSSSSAFSSNSELGNGTSSGSSSDDEYVLSGAQKLNTNQRKRRRAQKTRSTTCLSSSKNNTRKRRRADNDDTVDSDNDDDEEEEDNGHIGKNFALVMAIGERLRRQKEKLKKDRTTNISNEEDPSEEEDSWRVKAINEPLRKQQEQANNERKRKIRKSSQTENVSKQPKIDKKERTETHLEEDDRKQKYSATSSDESESDNVKLIELKTKLTTKSSNASLEGLDSNRVESQQQDLPGSANSPQQNDMDESTSPAVKIEQPQTETATNSPNAPTTMNDNEETNNLATQTSSEMHSSDDDNQNGIRDNSSTSFNNTEEQKRNEEERRLFKTETNSDDIDEQDHNENDYSNVTENVSSPTGQDEENFAREYDDDNEDDNEDANNIHSSINQSHESNVFDGTSMSTTTTDTILNDTAEQISSAAVNFYNPQQQSFNTADFADDNTSNSSCSESSVSSTSTSSSSNSSSSNTNGFVNYDLS
ncbi:topoisomerase I-interacting protein isoform X2 [Haematobia irritans]|uniref:topoisomerase I-interacting protein isoform X2 n=1 Tax=Haematobia irritans TaxID=7368 RepID=UPI003F4F3F53